MNKYKAYENPQKDILDTVGVGDLVKCNDWNSPLRVVAVSENFFIMCRKAFGTFIYSICHKQPADYDWGYVKTGQPYIGLDDYVFGKFDYTTEAQDAIHELESGEMDISYRNRIGLTRIEIKRKEHRVRKGFTKYDCNRIRVCPGVTVDMLKAFGFTNYHKPTWYYCHTLKADHVKGYDFDTTLNVSINAKTLARMEIEILDEAFCQPFIPLCEYYLKERTYETLNDYQKQCVEKADEILQKLIDAKILYIKPKTRKKAA